MALDRLSPRDQETKQALELIIACALIAQSLRDPVLVGDNLCFDDVERIWRLEGGQKIGFHRACWRIGGLQPSDHVARKRVGVRLPRRSPSARPHGLEAP